ncbi:MAG: hypothetical protein JG780_87 [Thermosipho sp. (in: Bacteria)]|jgi:hypothetical protein|nr:hypothetical protein [Thermosipho sp. (in: thermotogales)]
MDIDKELKKLKIKKSDFLKWFLIVKLYITRGEF